MTVRRAKRRDPETGTMRAFYIVDVVFQPPDGGRAKRIRRVPPVQTRRGAEQYEQRMRAALLAGTWGKEAKKTTPTLASFCEEFLDNKAKVHDKPSALAAKQGILKNHLLPVFGNKRLDEIGPRAIAAFKAAQIERGYSQKSINNHLAVLSGLLSTAAEWQIIAAAPKVGFFTSGGSSAGRLQGRVALTPCRALASLWRCRWLPHFARSACGCRGFSPSSSCALRLELAWRRRRDSNPRNLAVQRFSRPPP